MPWYLPDLMELIRHALQVNIAQDKPILHALQANVAQEKWKIAKLGMIAVCISHRINNERNSKFDSLF